MGILVAPFGPGCYECHRRDNGQLVLFGTSGHVAQRLTSLLPKPLGCGTRNNDNTRRYILNYLENIDYRTMPCASATEAKERERTMIANKNQYVFKT
jgi:hypothetical protein